ncbi:MAG: hypothetical protein ABJN75_23820 [Hoeflea sp.]|uniref:hypothetical protein n=1 Tax=Hoeflea sp. TaxID=1940281 RepID=UPI00329990F2
MRESPLLEKIVAVARAHPEGMEAGLQKAVSKINRWLDEREVDDGVRRDFQIRLDHVLADARKQLSSHDIPQPAPADLTGNTSRPSGANDPAKPAIPTQLRGMRGIMAVIAFAAIILVTIGLSAGLFPFFTQQPLFALDTGTTIGPGKNNRIERAPGETSFSVYSTAKNPTSAGTTGGAFVVLEPDVEDQASGRRIRVILDVEPVSDQMSQEFAVAYSTAAVGNSGWHKYQLDAGLKSWSFEYDVPKRQQKPGRDFIGIWADTSGGGAGVQIADIRVELVEAAQ